MSNVSLVNGHIDRPKMTDEEIIKALECCTKHTKCMECSNLGNVDCMTKVMQNSLDLINRQKAEIERLRNTVKTDFLTVTEKLKLSQSEIVELKSETIKEFAENITKIFVRYSHLHKYADQARTKTIESAEGYEIEMQSVWDVLSLKKYEMAEYEEMSELQKNIEIIAKERLLTELEKDFRLLVKELVGDK